MGKIMRIAQKNNVQIYEHNSFIPNCTIQNGVPTSHHDHSVLSLNNLSRSKLHLGLKLTGSVVRSFQGSM